MRKCSRPRVASERDHFGLFPIFDVKVDLRSSEFASYFHALFALGNGTLFYVTLSLADCSVHMSLQEYMTSPLVTA